ncbi:hypothetical protein CN157_14175 [Sinorhizobium meliloti]|nr:hypothetical protein CN157_14175 [Sinorhizobium meliloti]RVQ72599.1 hypothetical protein CN061_21635 [Sinorhizobium meliloti]
MAVTQVPVDTLCDPSAQNVNMPRQVADRLRTLPSFPLQSAEPDRATAQIDRLRKLVVTSRNFRL